MKIASWNVNSVRVRRDALLAWLRGEAPDVMCLQETKVVDADFPVAEIEDLGYRALFTGQKTYNGVAILVRDRWPVEELGRELSGDSGDEQRRFIEARVGETRVTCVYVPNGSPAEATSFATS